MKKEIYQGKIKDYKEKVEEKYAKMISEITKALNNESFTVHDAFPYVLTRIAKLEVKIDMIKVINISQLETHTPHKSTNHSINQSIKQWNQTHNPH